MESICEIKEVYKALYLFEKEFLNTHQITINEAMVLCCMKDLKAKSANELCDYIGLSNSRVSRIITNVEDKGLISRQMGSTDKRQMIFSLTEKGLEKMKEMQQSKIKFSDFAQKISVFSESK